MLGITKHDRERVQEMIFLRPQRIETATAITFGLDVEVTGFQFRNHPIYKYAKTWCDRNLSFFITPEINDLTESTLFIWIEINT